MSDYITSDPFLLARATWLYNHLKTYGRARLFTNNLVITPDTPYEAFAQADFAGYSWISLSAYLTPPVKVRAGLYQIPCNLISITSSGPPFNNVYGAYIDDGTNLVFSRLFPVVVPVGTGITVEFRVSPQVSGA